jgi:hypothetical protein
MDAKAAQTVQGFTHTQPPHSRHVHSSGASMRIIAAHQPVFRLGSDFPMYCRGLLEMNQNNRSLDQKNKIGRLTLQGDAPCNVAKGW